MQDSAHAPSWATTLRGRRLELGLTQATVADLASMSRRTVMELEQGSTSVTLANLLAVLRVLGLGLSLDQGHPGEIRSRDA